ncbi:tol-pal system protein [Roseovarius sp. HI0049]|nr:tol-pal system protein [Roseovarius sp. HI0049]
MRRVWIGILVAALATAGAAHAQNRDETLADIRQEMSVLYVELQKLKRELSTTGGASDAQVGGSVIDRVGAIESELQRLTSKTEELEFRIDQVVNDGTNRLGDLEFRLCELETDCDVGQLGQSTTLGGTAPSTGSTAGSQTGTSGSIGSDSSSNTGTGSDTSGVQMAVGEQADFDQAAKTMEEGDYAAAADQFALFIKNYPGSPLEAEAGLKRGEALEKAGETSKAARAYLDTFSAAPNGPKAADALFRLGRALGQLGQTDEACVTLAEVGFRFPDSQPAQSAQAERQALSCQ